MFAGLLSMKELGCSGRHPAYAEAVSAFAVLPLHLDCT